MRNYKLTIVAQHLNAALGSGRFNDIGYDEVVRRIEDTTIFELLSERLEMRVTLSVLTPMDRLELLLEWEQMIGCVDPYRFNGHRCGISLLIGYLLEGIQWRSSNCRHRLTDETATYEANVRRYW